MCQTRFGGVRKVDARPVGRDTEIAKILTFLSDTSRGSAALAITGDTGIGKTEVWKHVLEAAAPSSLVLSCRPTLAERPLAFSALDDLLGDEAKDVLPALTGSRGWAVAARGVLDGLRVLASRAPLMIAVDDAQWLDRSSARVLEFCVRRLANETVSILLTFHTGDPVPLGLDRDLPFDRLCQVPLGPLSLGAIGELLRARRGMVLPRHALTRLYEACGGNPFYALEFARALDNRPHVSLTNEPIPVPRQLSNLVRHRVRQLSPDVLLVGRLVAAAADPRERLIRAACHDQESWAAIDQAIDEGIIERAGAALRFTHPLLRSVLYGEMPHDARREVHQRLGEAAEGIEERAWHLALGADRPSEETAGLLDAAAGHAASRGAPAEAATLTEQAARLTPASGPEQARERTVRAAEYYFQAGETARSRELIESALPSRPAGPSRASPRDGLTETERRVAALVTRGRTNREVAAEMFVTENTVQTHVRHIFQKLGVRSRTELAALLLASPAGIQALPEYH